MLQESQLEGSFPLGQFLIDVFYAPFRLDCNKNVGIMLYVLVIDVPMFYFVMLYVLEDMPDKIISHKFPPAKSLLLK